MLSTPQMVRVPHKNLTEWLPFCATELGESFKSIYLTPQRASSQLYDTESSLEVHSYTAGQNIPRFYRTRRFVTVFTKANIWTLSWARWIQSTL
jgi:hypothetical protein